MSENLLDILTSMETYAHKTDPWTSHQAAKMLPVKRGKERHRLLLAFREHGPMTDQEAGDKAEILGEYDDRRHCSTLRKHKLIERTGETRPTTRGNPAMVCQITNKGLIILRDIELS